MFIHMVFVPTILLTSLLLACNIRIPSSTLAQVPAIPTVLYPYINLGVFSAFGYGLFYLSLDREFGSMSLPVLVFSTVQFSQMVLSSKADYINTWSFIVWVVAWIAQFFGHGYYEKRAPALLDNLMQALVMAPFFVLFEVSYMMNYRREILDEVDVIIKPELEAFHAQRNAKLAAKKK